MIERMGRNVSGRNIRERRTEGTDVAKMKAEIAAVDFEK